MLEPHIIKEIERQERKKQEREQPRIPLPLPEERPPEKKKDRGIIIIEPEEYQVVKYE